VPVVGEEAQTRAFVVATTPGADFTPARSPRPAARSTSRSSGDGWLVVQTADGGEAYTRVGNLQVGADGQLTTMGGRPVVGDNGALVPPGATDHRWAAAGVIARAARATPRAWPRSAA
jgi:flagellar basal-body rod protein FlgF